ncbi:MAG: hypothetical protein M0Z31_04360 [Clostridia bacterium]|nr:hypothetical protein [Clostridia bacterium]
MHQQEPWDLLSDQNIWNSLGNPDYSISEEFSRYMFIELFSRLKNLEAENHTLKVMLFENEIIHQSTYFKILPLVKEFLTENDKEKTKNVDFYRQSGISFVDWVNLFTKGRFKKD